MHTINQPVGELIADVKVIKYEGFKERIKLMKKYSSDYYVEDWGNCLYVDYDKRNKKYMNKNKKILLTM